MKFVFLALFQFFNTIAFSQSAKDSLFSLLGENISTQETAETYYHLGWEYYPNHPDSMIYFFDESVKISTKANITANSIRGKGVAYYLLTEYDKAVENYLKALTIFEESKDRLGVAKCYNALGLSFAIRKNYQEAIQYHILSMDITNQLLQKYTDEDSIWRAKELLGHNYINIMVAYEISPQKDSTLYYTEKSIEWFSTTNDSLYLAMSYNRKGQALYMLERYSEAFENHLFVKDNFNNLSKYEKVFTYWGLAQNSLELGKIEESIQYGLSVYEFAKEIKAKWHIQNLSKVLSIAYSKQNNFEKAYKYQVEFKMYSDSLFNEESEARMNELLIKQKALRTEKVLQENQLKEEELKVKNQQIFIVAAGFLILSVFVFILFNSQRRQKKLNSQLTELNQELKESNSSKDKFFSIIAHDLKSPFNSIIGFINILKLQIENLPKDDIKTFIDMMLATTNNTYKLLENLLDWSRLQTGDISFYPTNFSLNAAFEENVDLYKKAAEAKSIHLKFIVGEQFTVNADENMVNTILRNLISNAIKFTKSNGQVVLSYQLLENRVIISVQDTGVGISPTLLPKLFNVTEKFSTQGTAKEKGTGLGLVLSKEFVEKHGGSISVESKEDEGSTFRFDLPLGKALTASKIIATEKEIR